MEVMNQGKRAEKTRGRKEQQEDSGQEADRYSDEKRT